MTDDMKNSGFLFPQEKNILNSTEFTEMISQEAYYTVFVNIQAYPNGSDVYEIETYDDFNVSNCEIIMLITDNVFLEIYSKDENILKIIYENASENEFSDINYITESNYKREKFSAYSD